MGKLRKKVKEKNQHISRKPVKWPPSFEFGCFTSMNIRLEEVAINNLVLRVPLQPYKIEGKKRISKRKRKPNVPQVLKCKLDDSKEKQTALIGGHQNNMQLLQFKSIKMLSRKSISESVVPRKSFDTNKKLLQLEPVKRKVFNKQYNDACSAVKKTQYSQLSMVQSQLTMDFTKLPRLVGLMKLPSPAWQVTVKMNYDLTTSFKFTNNHRPYKYVTFSQKNPNCNIYMNEVPVILLGCPTTIDSIRDVEILLEIIDRLNVMDCMVN